MKITEFKKHLEAVEAVSFMQENGEKVPAHFHVTEIGLLTKHFIDCGGDVHVEKMASVQIWVAADFDHRLKPVSLLRILEISAKVLGSADLEIEVEYQAGTIGKYGLAFEKDTFVLVPKQTDCLARVKCDIPLTKQNKPLATLSPANTCCTPEGGCC